MVGIDAHNKDRTGVGVSWETPGGRVDRRHPSQTIHICALYIDLDSLSGGGGRGGHQASCNLQRTLRQPQTLTYVISLSALPHRQPCLSV